MALTDERERTCFRRRCSKTLSGSGPESKPSPIRRMKGRRSFELAAELGQGCRGESWVAEICKDPDCGSPAGSLVCSSVGMQGGPVQRSTTLSFSWQESPDAIMPGKLEWNKSVSLPRFCERIREKMLLQTERILCKVRGCSVSQISLQITRVVSFHELGFSSSYHSLSDQKSSLMLPWCYICCVAPEGGLQKWFH